MDSPSQGFLLQSGQIWVLLGDSITEDPQGYATICDRMIQQHYPELSLQIINAGVSGNKANDMLARLESDVLSHNPDWVSISVGINDVWHGFYDFERDTPRRDFNPDTGLDIELYAEALDQMVQLIMERGAQVLLVSPTIIGDDPSSRENEMVKKYAEEMASIADHSGLLFCPMNDLCWTTLESGRKANSNFNITWDGVHMNSAGAKMMAVGVLNSLGFFGEDA